MTGIIIDGKGGPEVLKSAVLAVPQPSAGQILVKVTAAGVNRPDVAQRVGAYPPPPGHSPLPGLEIAGEVVAVGPSVSRWKSGDAVCALVNGGGYAGYCIAEETAALPVPAGLDMVSAGALPVDRLLTHRLKLDEINQGFDRLARGEAVRQVILF